MNAMTETMPRAKVAAPHATHKFKLLLKREYWEHRGGFFWAPLIAGGVFLLLSLMGMISAEVFKSRAADQNIDINGAHVQIGGLDLSKLTQHLSAEDLRQFGGAVDVTLMMSAGIPFIVLGFVVLFYALGSLYDDRRDRSVLFWKSMPLSDTQTVLSKVVSATLVAPALATLAGILTMLALMVLLSLFVMIHGGNPFTLLWGPASPTSVIATFIAAIPVYAAWSMPAVGWLMLCSAWARSKPFLWAVMLPILVVFANWWIGVLGGPHFAGVLDVAKIVGRLLLSVMPGGWMSLDAAGMARDWMPGHGGSGSEGLLAPERLLDVLASANLWIGVAGGLVLLAAAVRLRGRRIEVNV